MASTAAEALTIVELIDDIVTARATNDKQERARIGEHEFWNTPLKDLMEVRKEYWALYQELSSGTEYWDHADDGITRAGSDNTVEIGDSEA